ncbi:MAG: lysophospholipid acyltransferase family protein [Sulfuricaulis sp.]
MSERNLLWLISLMLAVIIVGWFWRRLMHLCDLAHVADWGNRWLNRLDGLNRIFCRRFHHLQREPLKLPPIGGVLLASNHISGLDPLLLIACSPRPLRFLIAREQYDRWWLTWLFQAVGCIPVERAHNPRAALVAARQILERGEVVALFPHGRIHLDHQEPAPLKRGVVLLARKTGAPIYPVRIEGVRGQGLTVSAVFIPSHARVRAFAPMHCDAHPVERCLEKLWGILAPPGVHGGQVNPHRSRPSQRRQTPE